VKNFIAGIWIDKPKKMKSEILRNSVIDTVPRADAGDLERALAYANACQSDGKTFKLRALEILRKAADTMARATKSWAAHLHGRGQNHCRGGARRADRETSWARRRKPSGCRRDVPLDATQRSKKFDFTLRVPCGVVAASHRSISVEPSGSQSRPALAAGNSVM